MYTRFFGLKQQPFSLAPDPRYLYMSKRHREALAHLLYGVGGGGGFVLLSGEIGAGKTTVCRCFLEQIPKRCNVAYIFNPKLTVMELLKTICDEFHIPSAPAEVPTPTVKTYVDALNDFLLQTHAVGQNNVLIIDEAQMLSAEVLEQLRLLTNLETNERKLLQIVLIGQPELRTMLERPDLEQLAQRVIARFHLNALSAKETEHYIRHRLSVAGMTRGDPVRPPGAAADPRAHPRRAAPHQPALRSRHARRLRARPPQHRRPDDREGRRARCSGARRRRRRTRRASAAAPASPSSSPAGWRWRLAVGFALYRRLARWSACPTSSLAAGAGAAAGEARRGCRFAAASAPGGERASRPAGTSARDAVAMNSHGAAASSRASMPSSSAAVLSTAATAGAAAPAPLDARGVAGSPGDLRRRREDRLARAAADVGHRPAQRRSLRRGAREQVRCAQFGATLPMVKSLARPGLVWLRDDAGRTATALLVGLNDDQRDACAPASRRSPSRPRRSPSVWRGEFAHRLAPAAGLRRRARRGRVRAARRPPRDPDRELRRRAGASRRARRWTPSCAPRSAASRRRTACAADGKAGPTTFMQLNRAIGIDEPRLAADAAALTSEGLAMSYILDALRRADAERERGAVPGCSRSSTRFAEDDAAPTRPRRLVWAVVALTLALLAVIAWTFLGAGASTSRAPVEGSVVPAPLPVLPSAQAPMPPALGTATAPPAGTTTAPPTRRPSHRRRSPRIETRVAPAPAPLPPTRPTPAALSERPQAAAPVERASARSTAEARRAPQRGGPDAGASSATAAAPNAGAARVYTPAELPEEIRRDLPKIVVGGSSYSGDAASRMIMVNGQVFHEGDRLAPGLVLERIRQKSAVLSFKGWQYEVMF